ncbi:MAG: protein arginine kinase [Puniceicoccales bacterium]|jgi:protein arginine kinase|nr:protein arginine kinase [Puniceicoccales bacterium]
MEFPPFIFPESEPGAHGQNAQPIVLSTRIRLARNLAGCPFPAKARALQRRQIQKRCFDALATLPRMRDGHFLAMDSIDNLNRTLLVERHLISKELASAKTGAVAISHDQTCSVMVNEEDHLRIQVMRGGFQLLRAWRTATHVDTALERTLAMAYTGRLGYLTACPTNVGTGLRASAMLHLPGLVFDGEMQRVIRAVNQDGLVVRGWHGEGSESTGCIFQVSNQHTLGSPEQAILEHLVFWLRHIIEHEQHARYRLLRQNAPRLVDRIMRSYGTLTLAHLLKTGEAMDALSCMRLACDLGMLPLETRALVDRLTLRCQPAHIQAIVKEKLNPAERTFIRARLFREAFANTPPPDLAFARKLFSPSPAPERSLRRRRRNKPNPTPNPPETDAPQPEI